MENKTDDVERARESLKALLEETILLQLALLGAQASIDRSTLGALLRVADDLRMNVKCIAAFLESHPEFGEEL